MKDNERIKKLEERVHELEEYLTEIIHRLQYEIPGLVTALIAAEDDDELMEISRRWAEEQPIDEEIENLDDSDLVN